jgi:hypothetical protein
MNLDKLTAKDLGYLKTGINACCDWCGAYVHCPMCEDPAVYKRMNSGEIDDPMDQVQGGHIHWCSPEHLVFWTDAHYWTEHEAHDEEDRILFMPGCECHARREALLRDVEAGMRDDATEEEKRLAAEILGRKIKWCGQCDQWVLPEEMRPEMCIDCLAENELEDPEMKEQDQ